jgi:hypothetical protein
MSELPTLQEEVDRKVADTLLWLITGIEQGRLSKEQYQTGLDVLFMAVSGLTDNDFIGFITKAGEKCKDVKAVVHHVFTNELQIYTIDWVVGSDKVTTSVRYMQTEAETRKQTHQLLASNQAKEFVNDWIRQMIKDKCTRL